MDAAVVTSQLPVRPSPWSAEWLLEEVEQLPLGATGALVLGEPGAPRGAVLVQDGRICWAAARGASRRLSELILQRVEPRLDASSMHALFERCRAENRPLGETLVANGVLSPSALHSMLREHTCESLLLLSAPTEGERHFVPHRDRHYDARFTFSAAELMASIGSLEDRDLANTAEAELVNAVGGEGAGVAFTRVRGWSRAVPVAQVGAHLLGVDGVRSLAVWASTALDLSHAFDSASDTTVGSDPSGASALAWREGEVLYCVVCADSKRVARVMAKRVRRVRRG